MSADPELVYKIGIELIPKVGSISAKKLIAYCGSAEAVFKQKKGSLLKIPGIGEATAAEIVAQTVLSRAENELLFIEKFGIKVLYFTDAAYPYRLKQCEDGPVVLYVKSNINIDFNTDKVLSIVGTRRATEYGKAMCEDLVSGLAEKGYRPIIISGLAYGIDVTAHRAALKRNLPTVAVLGHGLNTIYPQSHRSVAKAILNQGALVSDFTSDAVFDRNNFLRRNRIIAGMADATLVVESALEGGALVTADIANSYNRDVFAVPGNVNSVYSQGCNQLIKQNKAALVESADDLEFLMGWTTSKVNSSRQYSINFDKFSADEQKILNFLKEKGEETVDVIAMDTGLQVSKVLSLLLNLEFAGVVRSMPGKVFALAIG
ncbi:MAG TPA: DNA-processing protein DprA [Tenuifilaceae bacterium]|jgi:DNA processing protein|nr:DNA-processing protein DprA [Bacteroidales bacterium]HNT40988.1 DNA-processing protein DprA [Tenuifilaceae bacterium]NLI87553.1 DNA-protecting protein DprA [Bacteroidales bacterium]HNY08722.1 DNA-processing protein DprA [Tenuifilaceae bacterium]HOA08683.1 DNA-processing protein DprA [Tenuifilaceae bacterium]